MVDHAGMMMEQGASMACERLNGVNDNIEKSHFHSYYEIYYLESGERHFIIENQLYSTRQGDFVLFPPHVMHHAYSGKDISFKRVLICFRPDEIISEELRRRLQNSGGVYHMETKQENRMRTFVELLLEEQENGGVCQKDYMKALLNSMVFTMLEKSNRKPADQPERKDYITDIIRYINYHYQEDISLQELADLFFISPPYLCRIFKKYTNRTVVQYINAARIMNAQRLIMETEDSITKISQAMGFYNVTHFNRVFKSITGTTPLMLRKAVRAREKKISE